MRLRPLSAILWRGFLPILLFSVAPRAPREAVASVEETLEQQHIQPAPAQARMTVRNVLSQLFAAHHVLDHVQAAAPSRGLPGDIIASFRDARPSLERAKLSRDLHCTTTIPPPQA